MVDESANAATTGLPVLTAPPTPACTDATADIDTRCTFAIASSKGTCLAATFRNTITGFTPTPGTPGMPGTETYPGDL